jgi:hypothetical protein
MCGGIFGGNYQRLCCDNPAGMRLSDDCSVDAVSTTEQIKKAPSFAWGLFYLFPRFRPRELNPRPSPADAGDVRGFGEPARRRTSDVRLQAHGSPIRPFTTSLRDVATARQACLIYRLPHDAVTLIFGTARPWRQNPAYNIARRLLRRDSHGHTHAPERCPDLSILFQDMAAGQACPADVVRQHSEHAAVPCHLAVQLPSEFAHPGLACHTHSGSTQLPHPASTPPPQFLAPPQPPFHIK